MYATDLLDRWEIYCLSDVKQDGRGYFKNEMCDVNSCLVSVLVNGKISVQNADQILDIEQNKDYFG